METFQQYPEHVSLCFFYLWPDQCCFSFIYGLISVVFPGPEEVRRHFPSSSELIPKKRTKKRKKIHGAKNPIESGMRKFPIGKISVIGGPR